MKKMKIRSPLLVAMALACSKPNPVPPPEEANISHVSSTRTQHYSGVIDEDFAIYTTGGENDTIGGEEGCYLELTPSTPTLLGYSVMKLSDYNCDGKVDRVTTIYSQLTHYATGKLAELNEKMKNARTNWEQDYLKFRGTCALMFRNEGEGYLVDEGCDDSVEWTVHKIFREEMKKHVAVEKLDSLLQRGMTLATAEHNYQLEDASLLEMLSLESLVNSVSYSPPH